MHQIVKRLGLPRTLHSSHTFASNAGSNRQRGATLVGYALVFSAIAVTSLAGIEALNRTSGDYLGETGEQVGVARPSRFETDSSSGSGSGGGSGGTTDPIDPPPPAAAFPAGVNPDPNVPVPTVTGGEAILTIPAGMPPTGNFDGSGPWDDDDYSFIFTEGMFTQVGTQTVSGDSDWGGDFTLVDGQTYCSFYYHYSPTINEGNNPTTTIDFGNTVVGVAGSTNALNQTDNQAFIGSGNYGPTSSPLEGSDKATINGSAVVFENYAVPNGADNARIITECNPPVVNPPMIQTAADAVLTGPWDTTGGILTSNGTTSVDAPNYSETATFTFVAPADGDYDIFGIVHGANGSDDSFWVDVNVDGAPADNDSIWSDGSGNHSYQWGGIPSGPAEDEVADGTGGGGGTNISPWTLTAGQTVTVIVSTREDGTELHQLELRQVG